MKKLLQVAWAIVLSGYPKNNLKHICYFEKTEDTENLFNPFHTYNIYRLKEQAEQELSDLPPDRKKEYKIVRVSIAELPQKKRVKK